MKKHLLFAILFFAFGMNLNAQLASGTVFTDDIGGSDVITGEKVDVQAWLADGKAVVINMFTTLAGPCWVFHATGWLEDLNARYGPEGTNQVRILSIEGIETTPLDDIYTNIFSQPGSWVVNPTTLDTISHYLIDNSGAATTLNVEYWPTIYVIRPDGTLTEIAENRYNEEYWLAAMGIEDGPNAFLSASLPNNSFCESTTMEPQSIDFENVGDGPLTSATFNVYANGTMLESVQYTGPEVGVFSTGNFQISSQTFDETTEISLGIADINGNADVSEMISSTIVKRQLMTQDFTFLFTTDLYALETSWIILDDVGSIIGSDTYEAGPEPFGGGGADANTTHEYMFSTTSDISCLTILVSDSYGDGSIYWDSASQPTPGYGIVDANGVVVKEANEGFGYDSVEGKVNTQSISAVPNLESLESSKVFPNPVSSDLNVELNFNENIEYSIDILNAYGQKVKALGNFSGSNFNRVVDVTELPTGMYLISINSELGRKTLKINKI